MGVNSFLKPQLERIIIQYTSTLDREIYQLIKIVNLTKYLAFNKVIVLL